MFSSLLKSEESLHINREFKHETFLSHERQLESINNQVNVMTRFRTLISKATLIKLYKAFILPYFYYCSSVWHFCGARNTDKIEVLNKRILSFILGDFESAYYNLVDKVNCASLYNKRIHNMLILLL